MFRTTPLILNGLPPIHWALAGAGIAAVTLLLLFVTNKQLGISTSYENICALGSRLPYFCRGELQGAGRWRLPFLGGLVVGGFLSAVWGGGWKPFWEMGMFDQIIGTGPGLKILWVFVGGLLIGLGTRIAGGCTSGHGIFGLSNFEKASVVSVLSFMAAGIVTTNVIYRLIFRI